MAFINFQKEHLADLGFSLKREFLLANHTGAYCSSSLINCNTRKYHGLLVVPQPQVDNNKYVLLSSLDETLIRDEKKYQLSTHHFPGTYYPEGQQYAEEFSYERVPEWLFKAGDVILKKEILLLQEEERLLIRYTIVEGKGSVQLQFNPFLAFRDIHRLTKSNINVNKKTEPLSNGIKLKMYFGFSDLYMQFSQKVEFVQVPDWHYNFEYNEEKERGYDYLEDLYCPGYFKLSVKKGDEIIFSAGLTEISPRKLKGLFESERKKQIPLNNLKACLEKAANQFITHDKKDVEVTAGFPWFGRWGRDTFISLPGLTLPTGRPKICKAVLDTMLKDLKDGLFPNTGEGSNAAYNTADASLWFFWALQQYAIYTHTTSAIWKEYGKKMKAILECYRNGTQHNIRMDDSGLLIAGEQGIAVTWMDAVVDGKPVTPRTGMTVELNALWYNAVCFALETAKAGGDKNFMEEWKEFPWQIEQSFTELFWDEKRGYLADYVHGDYRDWSLRPNQVIAASLPYSPVVEEIRKSLLEIVKEKLLTPRGLRTLSPDNEYYEGHYNGDQRHRDLAYHQGTVWPWLLGHFAEAYLKVHGEEAHLLVQSLYENFGEAVLEYGIGTIAEIYDGDAPYHPKGAISQAWSVAELLRIRAMIVANGIEDLKVKKEAVQL